MEIKFDGSSMPAVVYFNGAARFEALEMTDHNKRNVSLQSFSHANTKTFSSVLRLAVLREGKSCRAHQRPMIVRMWCIDILHLPSSQVKTQKTKVLVLHGRYNMRRYRRCHRILKLIDQEVFFVKLSCISLWCIMPSADTELDHPGVKIFSGVYRSKKGITRDVKGTDRGDAVCFHVFSLSGSSSSYCSATCQRQVAVWSELCLGPDLESSG